MKFLLALAAALLCSCGTSNWMREANIGGEMKPALRQIQHSNPSVKMDVIDDVPEYDVVIIRFIDAGHTRYVAIRQDQVSVMSHTTSGKGDAVVEDESIYTR